MAVAVICELNPFHNGHEYLFKTAKKLTGEPLVAIMSGSVTQRGDFASGSKFARAELALKYGADMVVELPAVYAAANAERFARGGVEIAKGFSCIDRLAFGCEADSPCLLDEAAFAQDDPRVGELVREQMKRGSCYPKALQNAVGEVFGSSVAEVLSKPNNILAVCYLRALKGSKISPLPIKRTGAEHDGKTAANGFASASLLRQMLENGEDIGDFVPEAPKETARPELLERAVLYKLRSMTEAELAALPDVSEGLEHRIYSAVRSCSSVAEILAEVKTKRYTLARLRRIILCAFTGITEELQTQKASYARVLGFTKKGAPLLSDCTAELVTSCAKAMRSQSPNRRFLEKDIETADLLSLAFKSVKKAGLDYTTKIIRPDCGF